MYMTMKVGTKLSTGVKGTTGARAIKERVRGRELNMSNAENILM